MQRRVCVLVHVLCEQAIKELLVWGLGDLGFGD